MASNSSECGRKLSFEAYKVADACEANLNVAKHEEYVAVSHFACWTAQLMSCVGSKIKPPKCVYAYIFLS